MIFLRMCRAEESRWQDVRYEIPLHDSAKREEGVCVYRTKVRKAHAELGDLPCDDTGPGNGDQCRVRGHLRIS